MYTQPQKKFKPKRQQDIEKELNWLKSAGSRYSRVFLADGDAMALSFRRLKEILLAIKQYLPDVTRVSSYCLPRNLLNKSIVELEELAELGLSLLYVGCESGDDKVLSAINKGETFDSSKAALLKIKAAGIKSSVMILNGMGGVAFSEQHARNSALLMNETQPEYLSTLVVSFPLGQERVQAGYDGEFQLPSTRELIKEQRVLIETLELESTIFRSDHASNYLVLKGILNKDKTKMIEQIDFAMAQPERAGLRSEWQRGL